MEATVKFKETINIKEIDAASEEATQFCNHCFI